MGVIMAFDWLVQRQDSVCQMATGVGINLSVKVLYVCLIDITL